MPSVPSSSPVKKPVKKPASPVAPASGRRRVAWLLTGLLVVVAASTLAMQLTSQDWFCGSFCHEMDVHISAVAQSAHRNTSCYSCHLKAGSGPLQVLMAKLSDLKELRAHVAGYSSPIDAGDEYAFSKVDDATCDQCHSILTTKVTPSPGMIIDHRKHLARGIRCTWCHNRDAHPGLAPYDDWMSMQACMRCHKLGAERFGAGRPPKESPGALLALRRASPAGRTRRASATFARIGKIRQAQGKALQRYQAPGACRDCHTPDLPLTPAFHVTTGWATAGHAGFYRAMLKATAATVAVVATGFDTSQGARAISRAQGGAGRGEVSSAPGSYPGAARPVSTYRLTTGGVKPCYACHVQGFCDDCHGIRMPHPVVTIWTRSHGERYLRNQSVCMHCHQRPFCQKCHLA